MFNVFNEIIKLKLNKSYSNAFPIDFRTFALFWFV